MTTILEDLPRKPPSKKRRLNVPVGTDPTVGTTPAPHITITNVRLQASQPSNIPSTKVTTTLTCTSCHRALAATKGCVIRCARCSSPMCAICSRTCTACAPSQPPTPHLTFSPSPSPVQSPRRSALALNTPNTNGTPPPSFGKRRKVRDEEEIYSNPQEENGTHESLEPGCGRTVCRDCSFEDLQSNCTTCYDCYGCQL